MAVLNRDGVEIYFEIHGSGPAVLLTHGFSATSQMWQGQIDEFSRDHTLILWDMRGHGKSACPGDEQLYGEAVTVDDMFALLDEAGAATATVGGLSLGGYMSLAFHLKYPQRVDGLLIIDTGPGYKNDEARQGWNRTAHATARDLESKGLAALAARSQEMDSEQHESADGLVFAARHMLTQRDDSVIRSLPDIEVPALVLVGENDQPFRNASDYMAAKIPDASLVVIEDAGHASNIDQRAAFNSAVRGFLDRRGI